MGFSHLYISSGGPVLCNLGPSTLLMTMPFPCPYFRPNLALEQTPDFVVSVRNRLRLSCCIPSPCPSTRADTLSSVDFILETGDATPDVSRSQPNFLLERSKTQLPTAVRHPKPAPLLMLIRNWRRHPRVRSLQCPASLFPSTRYGGSTSGFT